MNDFEEDIQVLDQSIRLFAQVMKQPSRWTKVIARSGVALDRPSAFILQTLLMHHPKQLHVQDLACRLGVEPPSVTRKTQELETAGYLQRTPDPEDRRAVGLELTELGVTTANRIREAQLEIISQTLESWPADDRHQFVTLFQRFSNELSETQPTPRKDT